MCRSLSVALLALTTMPLNLVLGGGLRGSLPTVPVNLVVDELSDRDMPDLDLQMEEDAGESELEMRLDQILLNQTLEDMYINEVDAHELESDVSGESEDPESDVSSESEDPEEEDEEHEEDDEHEGDEDDEEHEEDDEGEENDDDEEAENESSEDREDPEQAEMDPGQYEEQLQHLLRIGALIDTDKDNRLSHSELFDFAEILKNKKRWKHTMSSLSHLDGDGDGSVARAELEELGDHIFSTQSSDALRFKVADVDNNGILNETELHVFAHPEIHSDVLQVEAEHQFSKFDLDSDGFISFAEYKREEEAEKDFDISVAWEDFAVHDTDGSQDINMEEFTSLISGRTLLSSHIVQAIAAADSDGDGHIHLHQEVPNSLHGLLSTEFIEDYFYHESLHEEL